MSAAVPDDGSIEVIPVTPERHRKIKALVFAASEKQADERRRFLSAACEGDAALQDEVERLLDDALPDTADLRMPVGEKVAEIRQETEAARHATGPAGNTATGNPAARSRRRGLTAAIIGLAILAGAVGLRALAGTRGGQPESAGIDPEATRVESKPSPDPPRPGRSVGSALNALSEILLDLGDVDRAERALRASLQVESNPTGPQRAGLRALVADIETGVTDRPEVKETDRARLRRTLDEILAALDARGLGTRD